VETEPARSISWDVDGHAVKLVHESERANHLGASFFLGRTGLNSRSIGIEIVHSDQPRPHRFTEAQYVTALRLTREIRAAFPAITRQRVIGHGDVAVESAANLTLSRVRGRLTNDPGQQFEWERFEAAGHARVRLFGPPPPTIYGISPGQRMTRAAVPAGANVARLQRDLSTVGYSIHPRDGVTVTGRYDLATERAIVAFQIRYFSGNRLALRPRGFVLGEVDFETAHAVLMVAQDVF
jgi:N-acetylmuramoyl-L-alanine amidase